MRLKVYSEIRCPRCGRIETVYRVRRGRMVRLVYPHTCMVKCRMCLTQFMVHRDLAPQIQVA